MICNEVRVLYMKIIFMPCV